MVAISLQLPYLVFTITQLIPIITDQDMTISGKSLVTQKASKRRRKNPHSGLCLKSPPSFHHMSLLPHRSMSEQNFLDPERSKIKQPGIKDKRNKCDSTPLL